MKKLRSYKMRGKNALKVKFEDKTVTFEIREQFLTSPLSKSQAKLLVTDLQEWIDKGTQHKWAIKLLTDKFEELEEELNEERLHCDEGRIDFSDDYFERSDYAKALKVAINQLSR